MKPTNKIALITGGSRGLGRNTAINLARNGTDVILTYHSNKKEADSAVAEIVALGRKAVAIQLDTGHVGAFENFLEAAEPNLAGVFVDLKWKVSGSHARRPELLHIKGRAAQQADEEQHRFL